MQTKVAYTLENVDLLQPLLVMNDLYAETQCCLATILLYGTENYQNLYFKILLYSVR